MTKGKEVASWKSALAADAEKVAKAERPASSYISLKSGVMTYQDEALPDNQLDCVVVANCHEKTFYDRPYDPDDQGPPECFAQALEVVDLEAHDNVPEPVHTACKGCPKAEFGTAKTGKGPACKTYRKLMVMPVSALESGVEDAEIAVMRIPPTSVKNWSQYANKIASSAGLPPWAVQTRIKVKPHPKKQFEVSFEVIGPIEDEALLSQIHARIGSAEQVLLTPYEYDVEEEAPAATGSDKY